MSEAKILSMTVFCEIGDYQLPSNETGDVNLEECEQYPSCRNLSDGLYPTHDCRHYFQCKDERTLRIYSCPRNITTGSQLKFNYLTKRCDFVENVSFNCGGYAIPIDIYTNNMVCPSAENQYKGTPSLNNGGSHATMVETKDLYFSHPRECSIYIGCDESGNMSVLECLNGTHFSPYYQSCVHPSIAQCKRYATIDQTPINISLRLLIMNNALRNFDLELFNNSNETILEESYLDGDVGGADSSSNGADKPEETTIKQVDTSSEVKANEDETLVVDVRAINSTYLNDFLNESNFTQF